MKFLCERCKTKYSIGDDRVRGKILKIRCKNCSNVVTVRDEEGHGAGTNPPRRTPTGGALENAIDQALERSFDSVKASLGSIAPGQSSDSIEDEAWYVAVGAEQRGPMAFLELARKIERGEAGPDAFVWRDGLEDWVRADSVPELRPHLRKRGAVAARPMATPQKLGSPATGVERSKPSTTVTALSDLAAVVGGPRGSPGSPTLVPGGSGSTIPAATSMFPPSGSTLPVSMGPASSAAPGKSRTASPSAPVSRTPATFGPGLRSAGLANNASATEALDSQSHNEAELEFKIDEPSRVVKLDAIASMWAGQHSSDSQGAVFKLPGVEAAAPSEELPTSRSGSHAHPSPFPMPLAPEHHRAVHHYRLLSVVLGTVVLGLTVAVFSLWHQSRFTDPVVVFKEKTPEEVGAEIAEALVREAASKKLEESGFGARGDAIPPAAKSNASRKNPRAVAAQQKGSHGPGGSVAPAGGRSDRLGDLYSDTSKTGADLRAPERAQDDAVGMFKRGAKLCYERALKKDPSMAQATKVDVNVTTMSGGGVSNIDISQPYRNQFLGQCLSVMIKKLPWPNEGRIWQFPLVFRGS